jgi:2-amino-4-hydroxy-6-hydroxymethyldihydropteridine diphosphokinase
VKTAFLGLGANLGDRRHTLAQALRALDAGEVTVRRVSDVYETAPVGITSQPEFLNLVAEIETSLAPETLLARCLQIEAELGRVRRERWGPRTIDIDVLWCDVPAVKREQIELPHPRMTERSFVMIPLAEIAPELVVNGETAVSWAVRFGDIGVRRLGPLLWREAFE